jgi:hypothetical protein
MISRTTPRAGLLVVLGFALVALLAGCGETAHGPLGPGLSASSEASLGKGKAKAKGAAEEPEDDDFSIQSDYGLAWPQ